MSQNKTLYSSRVIAIASIVPGLGFWLLGQRRRAAQAFIITLLGAVVVYATHHATRISWVREVSFGALLLPWYLQGMWATNSVRLLSKRQENPTKRAKETSMDDVPGSSFSQGKARLERVEEIAIQQLEPDENMLAVIEVGGTEVEETSWKRIEHPFQSYYLALTEADLLIMEADWGGVPITVDRIPRGQVEEIHYFPGLTKGRLTLNITGKGMLEYQVGRAFLEEAQCLYDELETSIREAQQ